MIPNDAKKEAVVGTQSFTNLYDMLPEKLSSTMSKNLSIPIAFVCLLHLANEKVRHENLSLKSYSKCICQCLYSLFELISLLETSVFTTTAAH